MTIAGATDADAATTPDGRGGGEPLLVLTIPCYNEAARLDTSALERFAGARRDVRFILVDDGSTDATAAILRRLAAQRPESFSTLVLERNRGKAEAVRRGMHAGLQSGAALAGYWDADLATPLEEIDHFLETFRRRPDLVAVFGSRILRLGADIRRKPVRHYLGRVFATAASLALRLPTYDTQCGAKMFRACAPVRATFQAPFASTWAFDVEVIARLRMELHRGGVADPMAAFFELPLCTWRHVEGSKMTPRHMLAAIVDLLRIRHLYPARTPPR